MRRFFPFRSFTSNAGNDKAAPVNDAMNENRVVEGGTSSASRSSGPGARSFRQRSRHGATRNEESSHPQLRRSFSFSSSAIDRSLDERGMSCSHNIPCSMSNDSDAPGHFGEVECYTWSPERHPNRREYTVKDDIEIKLREEAMVSRVLKEKLLSNELDNEQLQSDLAASLRIQDVLQNEIQRVQDELRCLTHKSKHLEVQVLKKDGTINQIEQDYQESAKELTALRCMLKTVSDERDVSWQESKQLRRTVSDLQDEVASLKQRIRALNEDIMLKESEILLREGEISILRDSIDKPFDIICSPRSMKQFGME
nr:unnamed protein product [Digitaria exilis]